MSVNLHAEHLYDQIELVRGTGNRNKGQLCIMSFVAYLAGERHTDRPHTASRFIRNFAIQLNDGVSLEFRHDLKPFAPRIIGTNDGHDLKRGEVTFDVVMGELLPRALCDFEAGRESVLGDLRHPTLLNILARQGETRASDGIASHFRAIRDEHDRRECLAIATRVGQLLVTLVECAPTADAQRWYWAKALDLLDRLCDVGADQRAARKRSENITPVVVRHDDPLLTAQSKVGVQKIERRALQTISRAFRAALNLVTI